MSERYHPREVQYFTDGKPEPKVSVFKVPSSGPEWVERRLEQRNIKNTITGRENIFGEHFLAQWYAANGRGPLYEDKLQELRQTYETEAEVQTYLKEFQQDAWERARLEYGQLLDHLKIMTEGGNKEDPVWEFFYQFFRDQGQTHAAAKKSAERWKNNQPPKELSHKKSGQFITILEHRAAALASQQDAFEKTAIEYRERLKRLLNYSIKDGEYALDPKIMEDRLNSLEVRLVGRLENHLEQNLGDFHSEHHGARIRADLNHQKQWHTYVHEALHALGGQTERAEEQVDLPENNITDHIKTGLRLSYKERPKHLYHRDAEPVLPTRPQFDWLDEAITEQITVELIHLDDGIYAVGRQLLEKIMVNGRLDKKTFYDAYFENYRDTEKGGTPLPALKRLFDATNAAFGTRFLVDLDICVREWGRENSNGVVRARKNWRKLKDNFPEYIRTEADKIRKKLKERQVSNRAATKEYFDALRDK